MRLIWKRGLWRIGALIAVMREMTAETVTMEEFTEIQNV